MKQSSAGVPPASSADETSAPHSVTDIVPEIESYLRDSVGLDPDSTPRMIGRAVDRILSEKRIDDAACYLEILKSSEAEFDYLLEQVLVPETWFFRYPEAYHYLKRWVQDQTSRKNRLRILSVPCSTGEEPYSIAMTLLDAGLLPEQFVIDGADINARALDKARTGTYTPNSFRGFFLTHQDRYFEKHQQDFQLKKNILSMVNFCLWNVHQEPPAVLKTRYDIIFCRNLFIYFHAEAQNKMMLTLRRLLDEDGLLFTGHAEAGPFLSPLFRPITPLNAFVHRKSLIMDRNLDRDRNRNRNS
ncbi:protein-glutamate O-methyltransferase CheR [bacterium]|nr:protein-glutamate O-methyltransferase CheR [bacterium]MCI0602074.1 protein-glutamate O-methyltransferase CheR [bacterium]